MKMIQVPPGKSGFPVDLHPRVLSALLGLVSFTYPFPDAYIALAHDDDGISNGRLPNRTVNGKIIPGLFFVVRLNDAGNLIDLLPEDIEKYTGLFAEPEKFPPGQWKIHTKTEENENSCVIRIVSEWVASGTAKKNGYEPDCF